MATGTLMQNMGQSWRDRRGAKAAVQIGDNGDLRQIVQHQLGILRV
jgi:hypothetical protein